MGIDLVVGELLRHKLAIGFNEYIMRGRERSRR
jgi:hypothetical protein